MPDIRNELINALEREIIGPSLNTEYIDQITGEELLLAKVHGSPQARYGAGILYPKQAYLEQLPDDESARGEMEPDSEDVDVDQENQVDGLTEAGSDSDEEPVSLANQFKPSAMGFTVRFKTGLMDDKIVLSFKSAWYEKGKGEVNVKRRNQQGQVENSQYNGHDYLSEYWIRRPLIVDSLILNINKLFENGRKSKDEILLRKDENSWLKLNIFNRSTQEDIKNNFLTVTFTLVNDIVVSTDHRVNTANVLFQNELKLNIDNPELVVPYREKISATDTLEEKELMLLYRNNQIYAIGHGISVTWELNNKRVKEIRTAIMPVYEMPQIAPTSHVDLNMFDLSDEGDWNTAIQSLRSLEVEYGNWVNSIVDNANNNPELENYREAALSNAEKCRTSLERISKGINILSTADRNSDVVKAFRWMNQAMLWQQQRSKTPGRKWNRTGNGVNVSFVLESIRGGNNQFTTLKEFQQNPNRGRWRPFQLAFVLMNLESIVNPDSDERKIVDLIWFPTGGGKTEAYLGLTAFIIFHRRLKGKAQWNWDQYGGTTAIMRYTLRLLTTQQYERAASLICACDLIRRKNSSVLGPEAISIGLWVGGSSTPNKHDEARAQYNKLRELNAAEYNFIVMKCPCCAAQIGKLDQPLGNNKIKGLEKEDGANGRVLFKCENPDCEYRGIPLPLNVVDEYIYENPPTLLLGTVDKFAMITWNKDSGKLFGFRENSNQWSRITPPELIVQDELHLISGPLGTMVGLYETMVQTLCNNYKVSAPPFITMDRLGDFIPPKIVASSATISRAYEQVKSIYAIDEMNIFPAQGHSFGDTWFSEEKTISDEYPGRKYVGLLAPGYPSMQTAIVRAYAGVLQRVGELRNEQALDYYWTLMGYFNSIRELGGASSLVFSDIRERLSQIQQRELTNSDSRRFIRRHEELTSRISSSEIPEVLKKLESGYSPANNSALDICLATNMVATGVDVSRLGLMVIHGQPKTTAEYIQASSRVGRDIPKGPGLIITLYSPSKPRDKSQYEQFYSYHNRIYSNVEPTSVTPFSVSARQRALHAVIIGLIRHFSSQSMRENPIIHNNEFDNLTQVVHKIVHDRCKKIDPDEFQFTNELIIDRIEFWKRGFQNYGDAGNFGILRDDKFFPLMYANGGEIRQDILGRSLPTPTSMRGVDSESVVEIL